MKINFFVQNENFAKLISENIIRGSDIRKLLRKNGIIPICSSGKELSRLMMPFFFGSEFIGNIHEILSVESKNLKTTVIEINNDDELDIDILCDKIGMLQRAVSNEDGYEINSIVKSEDKKNLNFKFKYHKLRRGRVDFIDKQDITLSIKISKISEKKYRVNIIHDGASDAKEFITFLQKKLIDEEDNFVPTISRLTLGKLSVNNKIDFFDIFPNTTINGWKYLSVTNVSVSKSSTKEDEDQEDIIDDQAGKGLISGISNAILSGEKIRDNQLVKEFTGQNFYFDSMLYKFESDEDATEIEIGLSFKQGDLKISIINAYRYEEDDDKLHKFSMPQRLQEQILEKLQENAAKIYNDLIKRQGDNTQLTV